jgi:hypothetical protein
LKSPQKSRAAVILVAGRETKGGKLLVLAIRFLAVVLLPGITFFADLAVFLGGDAALMGAGLAFGFGFFATVLFGGKRGDGQQYGDTKSGHQCFDEFHKSRFF